MNQNTKAAPESQVTYWDTQAEKFVKVSNEFLVKKCVEDGHNLLVAKLIYDTEKPSLKKLAEKNGMRVFEGKSFATLVLRSNMKEVNVDLTARRTA